MDERVSAPRPPAHPAYPAADDAGIPSSPGLPAVPTALGPPTSHLSAVLQCGIDSALRPTYSERSFGPSKSLSAWRSPRGTVRCCPGSTPYMSDLRKYLNQLDARACSKFKRAVQTAVDVVSTTTETVTAVAVDEIIRAITKGRLSDLRWRVRKLRRPDGSPLMETDGHTLIFSLLPAADSDPTSAPRIGLVFPEAKQIVKGGHVKRAPLKAALLSRAVALLLAVGAEKALRGTTNSEPLELAIQDTRAAVLALQEAENALYTLDGKEWVPWAATSTGETYFSAAYYRQAKQLYQFLVKEGFDVSSLSRALAVTGEGPPTLCALGGPEFDSEAEALMATIRGLVTTKVAFNFDFVVSVLFFARARRFGAGLLHH